MINIDDKINNVANIAAKAVLECRKVDANKLSIDLLLLMLCKNRHNDATQEIK